MFMPRELFATQGLHQEHEAPDTHRSEDGEEGDGEPEGCLGDETGQFVHGLIAMNDYLAAKIHRLPEKGCDNSAIGVTILKVFGHVGVTIFKIVTPFSPIFTKYCVNLPPLWLHSR
jgi:hypothetical protein